MLTLPADFFSLPRCRFGAALFSYPSFDDHDTTTFGTNMSPGFSPYFYLHLISCFFLDTGDQLSFSSFISPVFFFFFHLVLALTPTWAA